MGTSGSSIKVGINGRSTNAYQEGQAVKQKVFNLPQEVNGVQSLAAAHHHHHSHYHRQ
jgi:hypothetical protein